MYNSIFVILTIFFSSCAIKTIPLKDLPSWSHNDCFSDDKNYYFIGSAHGKSLSEATTKALLDGKRKAAVCIFGGKVKSNASLESNLKEINYESTTDVQINLTDLSWKGFSKVSGKQFLDLKEDYFVLFQYKWKLSDIKKEESRVTKLTQKIDYLDALNKEIALKKKIREEKMKRLDELQKEEAKINSVKISVANAIRKIKLIKKSKNEKSNYIYHIFKELDCGDSLKIVYDNFRRPDSVTVMHDNFSFGIIVNSVLLHWGEITIKVPEDYLESYFDDISIDKDEYTNEEYVKAAINYKPDFFYNNFARNNRGWKICK